jgi:hypothetical protein
VSWSGSQSGSRNASVYDRPVFPANPQTTDN